MVLSTSGFRAAAPSQAQPALDLPASWRPRSVPATLLVSVKLAASHVHDNGVGGEAHGRLVAFGVRQAARSDEAARLTAISRPAHCSSTKGKLGNFPFPSTSGGCRAGWCGPSSKIGVYRSLRVKVRSQDHLVVSSPLLSRLSLRSRDYTMSACFSRASSVLVARHQPCQAEVSLPKATFTILSPPPFLYLTTA